MTLYDLITISIGNLSRRKLRTWLATSGAVIAISAMVALLAFGAGNRRLVTEHFEELGLLHTMQVFPAGETEEETPVLDDETVAWLGQLPDVRLAYPYDSFAVHVTVADTVVSSSAQPVLSAATQTRLFSQIVAGSAISGLVLFLRPVVHNELSLRTLVQVPVVLVDLHRDHAGRWQVVR